MTHFRPNQEKPPHSPGKTSGITKKSFPLAVGKFPTPWTKVETKVLFLKTKLLFLKTKPLVVKTKVLFQLSDRKQQTFRPQAADFLTAGKQNAGHTRAVNDGNGVKTMKGRYRNDEEEMKKQ